MKKIILILAVCLGTLSAFASDETVSQKVLSAFKSEFASAQQVNWSTGENFFKAEFTFNGQHVNAYYTTDGDLIGLTRNITVLDLPINLQANLKKSYSDYWISDLFEVNKSNSTSYYITLENADAQVVLKASASDDWSVYKKAKKI